jgi:predicted RecA/RadA family phage recombinase
MITEAKVYKQGDVLDHTPVSALVGGQVISVGGLAAIAQTDIAAGALGSIVISGLVKFRAAAVAGEAGDPVGWDENGTGVDGNTGALTVNPATWDFVVGSLAKDLAATDGEAVVRMNQFSITKPYWPGRVYETKTANYTLDIQDVGKVICCATDAMAFTLPAWSTAFDGAEFIFVNTALSGAAILDIQPNSSDKIMAADATGADDGALINTKATAKRWDWAIIRGDGVNGWIVNAANGIWATT